MAPPHPTLPHKFTVFKKYWEDFPGGPVVTNMPANAGDTGSIPGWGSFHMIQSN